MNVRQSWLEAQNNHLNVMLHKADCLNIKLLNSLGYKDKGKTIIQNVLSKIIPSLKNQSEFEQSLYGGYGLNGFDDARKDYGVFLLKLIEKGESVSPFLPSLPLCEADPVKFKRLASLDNRELLEKCFSELADEAIANIGGGFELERIMQRLKPRLHDLLEEDKSDIVRLHWMNESTVLSMLDKLYLSAGQFTVTISKGTTFSHSGVVNRSLEFDSNTPVWTTIDLSKEYYYSGLTVQWYETLGKEKRDKFRDLGAEPRLLKGILNEDISCADFNKTSFHDITNKVCNNDPEKLKSCIKYWCVARGFDGMVGTNKAPDELLLASPDHATWSLTENLPLTNFEFEEFLRKKNTSSTVPAVSLPPSAFPPSQTAGPVAVPPTSKPQAPSKSKIDFEDSPEP